MADKHESIGFEHKGIGAVLAHHQLAVPINQREYSWEEEHVQTLLEDLNSAISGGSSSYFLGTIVLTKGVAESPEVTDGQQRLATATMLIASVRDYFLANGEAKRAATIESSYLRTTDLATENTVPKLKLNVDDNDFFIRTVVTPPSERPKKKVPAPTRESHKRIVAAFETTTKYVLSIVEPHKKTARVERLIEWVKFLDTGAQVIVLRVPDHLNAFVMFETLNDRGLRASQADLLKNYLLSQVAGDRLAEAQQFWARMLGIIDSLSRKDLVVDYLRHSVICKKGPTVERILFQTIRDTINSQAKAMDFLRELASGAQQYAALFNPEHAIWNDHGETTRGHIRTILELQVEQIRSLMFAVLQHFSLEEAKKAFRLFVAWSVRFLIAGGGRGGLLDRHYGLRAQEVTEGKIKTTKELAKAMMDVVPPDGTFVAAFAEARVSQAHLARYYLRALERQVKGDPEPEHIPNQEEVVNLEHILPQTPAEGWKIDPEIAEAYYKRLGNMVLLRAKKNVAIGNKPFKDKKAELSASAYILTKEAGAKQDWGQNEISERQSRLAELSQRTWPITVS